MHMNSTSLCSTSPVGRTDMPLAKPPGAVIASTSHASGLARNRREQRAADRIQKRGRPPAKPSAGDPLGNGMMAVYRAGTATVGWIAAAIVQPFSQTVVDTGTAALIEPPIEHPLVSGGQGELVQSPSHVPATSPLDRMGDVMGQALNSLMSGMNWRIGPVGADAAFVDDEASQACGRSPDGSSACATSTQAVSPSPKSQITLHGFTKWSKASFRLQVSPSLQKRDDKTLSNAFIVIVDDDHYSPDMQQLINDSLSQLYEAGDRLFVESSADEQPAPVVCRGMPPDQCIGFDEPAEIQRLIALAERSIKLTREAQHLIASLSNGRIVPTKSNSYGEVKAAFIAAYDLVRSHQIPVVGHNVAKLQSLTSKVREADAEFQIESHSFPSLEKRNLHMAETLERHAAALDGHKGFVAVGRAHLDSGLRELLMDLDCVVMEQTRLTEKQLATSTW